MKQRQRDETYIWGPCMFDVEAAKALARRPGLPVYPIKPHKCLQGLPPRVPATADLEQPVIFATFLNEARDQIGAVMIDGRHRLAYALEHGQSLYGVILDPVQTVHLCSGFSQLGKADWRRLYATARHIGLYWGPRGGAT